LLREYAKGDQSRAEEYKLTPISSSPRFASLRYAHRFISTAGQFVLLASLRIQTTPSNQSDFPKITPERAFTDFLFASVILHFFVVNYLQ
jgi:hypothetical protein